MTDRKWLQLALLSLFVLLVAGVSSNDGSLLIGGNASGVGVAPSTTASTTNITMSTATTTQIVALTGGQSIAITHIHFIAGGTSNVSLVYGTGSNCGTGTTTIDGPLPLGPQTGFSAGDGFGAVEIIPSGNALCILSSAAVNIGGAISWEKH